MPHLLITPMGQGQLVCAGSSISQDLGAQGPRIREEDLSFSQRQMKAPPSKEIGHVGLSFALD